MRKTVVVVLFLTLTFCKAVKSTEILITVPAVHEPLKKTEGKHMGQPTNRIVLTFRVFRGGIT